MYGGLGGGTQLDAAGWNDVIVGATMFLVAGYDFYRMSKGLNVSGAAGLVTLLGVWLVVAPFAVFDMGTEGLLWSTAASGLIAASTGAYKGRRPARERRRHGRPDLAAGRSLATTPFRRASRRRDTASRSRRTRRG
ncbi:hypothetical protein BRD03_12610 [Halobacteriales archaeon QS_9_68_17]|nr:MAG: hypothetical protein BRD03_12610 [Halobacteriales archaeon QS_9_68_17]